jgi:hypothetical protein
MPGAPARAGRPTVIVPPSRRQRTGVPNTWDLYPSPFTWDRELAQVAVFDNVAGLSRFGRVAAKLLGSGSDGRREAPGAGDVQRGRRIL